MIQLRYRITLVGYAIVAATGFLPRAAWTTPQPIYSIQRDVTPGVARCFIRREGLIVDRWLATAPDTRAEISLFEHSEPRFNACFGYVHNPMAAGGWLMEYNRPRIRAALIQAKLQDQRDSIAESISADKTSLSWYSWGTNAIDDESAKSALVVANISACLALKHWRDVRTMILAVDWKVESSHYDSSWLKLVKKREDMIVQPALSRVVPSIAGCVPEGVTVHLDRARLRAMLEEAAYHMMQTP